MTTTFDTLAQQLRTQGHKLTGPRRAILQTLLEASRPLSPAEIQTCGQVYCADLGLVTVYRTLEMMAEIGIVRPVHLADNCHGYVLATPGHTHHLVCVRCHAVVEIAGCDLGDFLDSVAARTGYTITGHWLEISGFCAECQRNGHSD
jgi:Fur family ferric uptake transcriptional regulator